ncbi:MAG: hypothetical protein R3E51_00260 [Rhizobiaceae bacterium]
MAAGYPAYYGGPRTRTHPGGSPRGARRRLFDGSPLGKIEVIGPGAAGFLDFIYYNTMSTLSPGRCRCGFILTEGGNVYDDGVLVRLDENRFVVSCSSSHVAGVHALLEEWRQDPSTGGASSQRDGRDGDADRHRSTEHRR